MYVLDIESQMRLAESRTMLAVARMKMSFPPEQNRNIGCDVVAAKLFHGGLKAARTPAANKIRGYKN
jgi:hypothetical protein